MTRMTPKRAARFARLRMQRIEKALTEIAGRYGDVDNAIVMEVDRLRDEELPELSSMIDDAEAEGRCL